MTTVASRESTTDGINGFKDEHAKEIEIPVPWGYIKGKWWGSMNVPPLVALHGWQDNAGSFDALAPLLLNHTSILCIDLPGHGYSSHLPNGQFYYLFWDGVITLRRIVKHYKWNKVKLIGHSLGGAISFLYAAAFPDEVDLFISLDIASPSVRDVTKTVAKTGENIDKFLKYEISKEGNILSYNYDNMIEIVELAHNGSINRKGAEILMRRGMQSSKSSGAYYFSRDSKLKVSLLGTISLDLVLAYAREIKCAYLNIRAVPGMKFDQPENYNKVLNEIKIGARRFEYHEVTGTHHVHLTDPEKIVSIIREFINTS